MDECKHTGQHLHCNICGGAPCADCFGSIAPSPGAFGMKRDPNIDEVYQIKIAALRTKLTDAAALRDSLYGDLAAMRAQLAEARQKHFVPGAMKCAKCGFGLQRVTLHMANGAVSAGDNDTEPCPNGCGPLWPETWEQRERETYAAFAARIDEFNAIKARADLAESRLARMALECRWANDGHEDGLWESSCGMAWTFPDGGPKDNEMKFCPGCGANLIEDDAALAEQEVKGG